MEDTNNIKAIADMLNTFISGDDRSMAIAGKIEVSLDELFPDDDEIQDFVTDFASYRPEGGEYLYDENRMIQICKHLLSILESRYRST